MGSFIHWFNVELWAPMWPNIMSPNFWTIAAVAVSHLRLELAHQRRHDELMGR